MWILCLQAIIKNILLFGISSGTLAVLLTPLQFLRIRRQSTNQSYWTIYRDTIKQHSIWIFFGASYYNFWLNFTINGSFGLIDSIINNFIAKFNVTIHIILLNKVFVKSIFGGLLETLLTANIELNLIVKSKEIYSTPKVSEIIVPIFLRNSLVWFIIILSSTICIKLSCFICVIIGFLGGLIASIASMPFDVIATSKCGNKNFNLKKTLVKLHWSFMFSGTSMRLLNNGAQSALLVIIINFS